MRPPGVVRELEKEIRHGTQTAIIVSAAEIVRTMPAAGAPAATKAAKATVSAKVEGLDAFCERTTLLHELSYGIFEQEGQVKAMRIQLSKLGATARAEVTPKPRAAPSNIWERTTGERFMKIE